MLLSVATEEIRQMNVLEKVKTDKRIAEIQKEIDSGESQVRPAARVASGEAKKPIIPAS